MKESDVKIKQYPDVLEGKIQIGNRIITVREISVKQIRKLLGEVQNFKDLNDLQAFFLKLIPDITDLTWEDAQEMGLHALRAGIFGLFKELNKDFFETAQDLLRFGDNLGVKEILRKIWSDFKSNLLKNYAENLTNSSASSSRMDINSASTTDIASSNAQLKQ